jgi:uncharacterized protein YjiS (DUF1127 family)
MRIRFANAANENNSFPSNRPAIYRRSGIHEEWVMASIIIPPRPKNVTICRPLGVAAVSLLDRLRAAVRSHTYKAGNPKRLLKLNDRLLRDIGLTRTELEYEALFWPLRRPTPTHRS